VLLQEAAATAAANSSSKQYVRLLLFTFSSWYGYFFLISGRYCLFCRIPATPFFPALFTLFFAQEKIPEPVIIERYGKANAGFDNISVQHALVFILR